MWSEKNEVYPSYVPWKEDDGLEVLNASKNYQHRLCNIYTINIDATYTLHIILLLNWYETNVILGLYKDLRFTQNLKKPKKINSICNKRNINKLKIKIVQNNKKNSIKK